MREVTAVIDRWAGDDHCYVRVETDGGDHYILRQDLCDHSWRVQFFEGSGGAGAPYGPVQS